jgi:hypothetical protein
MLGDLFSSVGEAPQKGDNLLGSHGFQLSGVKGFAKRGKGCGIGSDGSFLRVNLLALLKKIHCLGQFLLYGHL